MKNRANELSHIGVPLTIRILNQNKTKYLKQTKKYCDKNLQKMKRTKNEPNSEKSNNKN